MKLIYLCSDNMTGLFSALHDAWLENRNGEAEILIRDRYQRQFFCEYRLVDESRKKEERLLNMIRTHLGTRAYESVYHALLSEENDKATAVFRMMQEARNLPDSHKIMDHLGNRDVARVFELGKRVANEAHLYIEFIRFRELENGILYSEISPKTRVLSCIGDHFSDRFPRENLVVYDKTHETFLIHKADNGWMLYTGGRPDQDITGSVTEKEEYYKKLWRRFFDSIAIQTRENERCQKTNLPLRYRTEMPEFDRNEK